VDHLDDTSDRALSPSLSLIDIVLHFSIAALLLSMIAMTMVVVTVVGFLLTALSYQFTKILVPTGVRLYVCV
jgi:hypothetical protein